MHLHNLTEGKMGTSLLIALVCTVIGVAPLMLFRKFVAASIMAVVSFFVSWLFFYCVTPSLVWPMFGGVGAMVLVLWFITAIVDGSIEEEPTHACWFPVILLLFFAVRGCGGCSVFRSDDYAKLIGEFPEKEWTQDVQPASAKHIRLVPWELACFLADKQLGNAPGAIGSQFFVDKNRAMIQRVKGEFWWVMPLDYQGFRVWTSVDAAPGYIMVHADDPSYPPILKYQEKFVYTPGAYFGDDLERHLWMNGYLSKGLTDYALEIDEEGEPWWVVTVFEPTIAFWGKMMTGVAMVHPTTGDIKFYAKDKIPDWVDRALPAKFINSYIDSWGEFRNGWVNSWWDKKDLIEPEPQEFVYGTDGEPYWVTRITSTNKADAAVVGVFYTNSRTGQTTKYHAVGATDEGVLQVVNSKVAFKQWHGVSPTLYNIYGVMTSVVPLLGSSHVFQGVALVNVENQQAVVAENLTDALREYQRLLAGSGNVISPETAHSMEEVRGIVDRFAAEVRNGHTVYYFHLTDVPHLFTGGSDNLVSPKMPLTVVGDSVVMSFIPSGEDVVPIMKFDNASFQLKTTASQDEVRQAAEQREEEVEVRKDATDARAAVKEMSDEELRELMKLRDQQKSAVPVESSTETP